MYFVIVLVAGVIAGVAGGGYGNHHIPPHAPARFYDSHSPKIIASPKPRAYNNLIPPPPPNYRTVNPVYVPYRSPRSNHPPPQMIASPSSTPVLVLKKDHTRPILSTATHPHAQKRSELLPTIQMERAPVQQVIEPHTSASTPNLTTTHRPSSPLPPQPELLENHESEETHNNAEPTSASGPGPTASAERRMFFESVANNQGLAQQVSGPRPRPTGPDHNKAAAASSLHQHGTSRQHNRRDENEDEEEDDRERITRSNQYQGNFQYPPPQNFIAQGPTRVPVKYQQGVIGLKPQFAGGPQHHQARKPQQQQRPYKQRIQQAQQPGSAEEPLSEEEELEEEAQPDRLTELLATSKFQCGGKKDGYYADDTLNCEVFHYCQDGGKHSWLCPNGFAFHQIHLICVPPSSDNICKQSNKFHFVNEYLYKPINEKEANTYNESLKYADRYFPDGYNHGAGDVLLPYHQSQEQDNDEQQQQQPPHHHQYAQNPSHHQARPQQHYQSGPPRAGPYNPYAQQPHRGSGFIPSQQINPRVPVISSPQNPYLHQHSSGSQLHPQVAPPVTKNTVKSKTNANVFFTPESINIPLNQRRPIPNPHAPHHPQIFRPSPQVTHTKKIVNQQKRKFVEYDDEY